MHHDPTAVCLFADELVLLTPTASNNIYLTVRQLSTDGSKFSVLAKKDGLDDISQLPSNIPD